MSEIRDKVEKQIDEALWAYTQSSRSPSETINQILSIPALAIVDREAELPTIPDPPIYSEKPYGGIERRAFRVGALTYRNSIVKAGWVKEVENDIC